MLVPNLKKFSRELFFFPLILYAGMGGKSEEPHTVYFLSLSYVMEVYSSKKGCDFEVNFVQAYLPLCFQIFLNLSVSLIMNIASHGGIFFVL